MNTWCYSYGIFVVPIVLPKDFVDYSQEILASRTIVARNDDKCMAQVAPRPPLATLLQDKWVCSIIVLWNVWQLFLYEKYTEILKINQDEKTTQKWSLHLNKRLGFYLVYALAIILMYGIIDAVFTTTVKTGFDLSAYVEKIIQFSKIKIRI